MVAHTPLRRPGAPPFLRRPSRQRAPSGLLVTDHRGPCGPAPRNTCATSSQAQHIPAGNHFAPPRHCAGTPAYDAAHARALRTANCCSSAPQRAQESLHPAHQASASIRQARHTPTTRLPNSTRPLQPQPQPPPRLFLLQPTTTPSLAAPATTIAAPPRLAAAALSLPPSFYASLAAAPAAAAAAPVILTGGGNPSSCKYRSAMSRSQERSPGGQRERAAWSEGMHMRGTGR